MRAGDASNGVFGVSPHLKGISLVTDCQNVIASASESAIWGRGWIPTVVTMGRGSSVEEGPCGPQCNDSWTLLQRHFAGKPSKFVPLEPGLFPSYPEKEDHHICPTR